nr:hypothetical protein [Caldilineaceae bacterium]
MNNGLPPPFPSLAALRTEHALLLRSYQESGHPNATFRQVQQFLRQGQATGALLDAEQERWTAQSLLDYWSATLISAGQEAPDALLADFDPTLAPTL